MNTGKGSKVRNGRAATPTNRAVGLKFSANRLVVTPVDGREISVPLEFYPTLLNATRAQRAKWEIIGDGQGFHWSELDLDLSAEGLVQGLRESIPAPPAQRAGSRRGAARSPVLG